MLLMAGCGDGTRYMHMTEVCKGLVGHLDLAKVSEWQSKAVFVMKTRKNIRCGDSVVSSDSLMFVCLLLDVGNLWISSHTSWTCGLFERCNLPRDGCDFLHCVVSCFQLDSCLGWILIFDQFIP